MCSKRWANRGARRRARGEASGWGARSSRDSWRSRLVLLTGAGLLGRSLLRVLSVDPGFRTDHIVTVGMALTFAGSETSEFSSSFAAQEKSRAERVRFLSELLEQLRQIPGVQDVGGTSGLAA